MRFAYARSIGHNPRPMALFENLTARLSRTVDTLRGRGRITEENVGESLREVRMALLEADVALPVVKTFIERVKQKALGAEVTASLTPGPGLRRHPAPGTGRAHGRRAAQDFELRAQPPVVVLLAGLQGAGKTTTAGKLARWLIESHKKRVLLVSTDVRRPAADAAAAATGRAGGRRVLSRPTASRSRRTSPPTRSTPRARAFTTC